MHSSMRIYCAAENLLLYAEEHVIFGQYAFEEWDPKLVEYLLTFFTPDNMRIDFVTKNFNKESVGNFSELYFCLSLQFVLSFGIFYS